MKFPTSAPLRLRLSALSIATLCLFVPWDSLHSGISAFAAGVDGSGADGVSLEYGIGLGEQPRSINAEGTVGHGWEVEERGEEVIESDANEGGYRGDFVYFEPELVGRAPEGVDVLTEGDKLNKEAAPGTTKHFVLERSKSAVRRRLEEGEDTPEVDAEAGEVQKRQTSGQLYISVNTCSQPVPDTPIAIDDPPQLTLYVSTSARNQKPGPGADGDLVRPAVPLEGGAAIFSVPGTDTDVYVGIEAPSLTDGWKGNFRFEVAVSSDRPYHSYTENDPFLFMIDTDSESALFITPDLTNSTDNNVIQKWLDVPQNPFDMYAFPETAWGAKGLEHSACGIQEAYGTNNSNVRVDKKMTERYGDDEKPKMPKGQFHVQGLQKDTRYVGFLLMNGEVDTGGVEVVSKNLTVGRGGRVWRKFFWTTKADDSCQVIFNLPFCTTIAHAVPSSPDFKQNTTALATLYDEQASSYFANFSKSLAQIPCNTTSTAQYSLARNCTHCATAYKAWLCAVLMPRCEDYSAPDPWLQPRNIAASFANGSTPFIPPNQHKMKGMEPERWGLTKSRNPMIDNDIKPGPYKELLPCEDLCFDIVRSCPATLKFGCPVGEMLKRQQYGVRTPKEGQNEADRKKLRCSFPGAVVDLNTAKSAGMKFGADRGVLVTVSVALVGLSLW